MLRKNWIKASAQAQDRMVKVLAEMVGVLHGDKPVQYPIKLGFEKPKKRKNRTFNLRTKIEDGRVPAMVVELECYDRETATHLLTVTLRWPSGQRTGELFGAVGDEYAKDPGSVFKRFETAHFALVEDGCVDADLDRRQIYSAARWMAELYSGKQPLELPSKV